MEEYIKPITNLKEPIFDIELIPECILNIEVGTTFFRFAVKFNEKFIVLEEYNYTDKNKQLDFIKELFHQHAYLSARFWKKINLIIYSTKKTMVPSQLGQMEAEKIWISLFGKTSTGELISTYIIKEHTLVYQTDHSLITFFREFYANKQFDIFPSEAALFKISDSVIFHFDGIGCTATFRGQSYYHINWKTLHSLTSANNLILTGEITKYALAYRSMIATNIKVEIAVLNENIQLSPLFSELPRHRYFIIFST
jgi:hypothetical protein